MLNYDPQKIAKLRKERGWNQFELGRRSQLSANTIWNLERGRIKMVKYETLAKLAGALGVPVQAILSAKQPTDLEAQFQAAAAALTPKNKAAVLAAIKALLDSQ